jgi:hypothetical protein
MSRDTWTDFLLGYYICPSCEIVDRDKDRAIVDHPCSRCGNPSSGGIAYFDRTVCTIADFIAELYPMPDLDSPSSIGPLPHPSESHRLAILLFFCTLGETLQQQFLERCVSRSDLPPKIQANLLQSILHPLDHIEQYFQDLTGATWQQAVTAASKHAKSDFRSTLVIYILASKKRNQLLLLGNKLAVSPKLAKQCFDHMAPLITLFVELHNIYLVKPL